MKRTRLVSVLLSLALARAMAQANTLDLPAIAAGPFKPDWNSLTNYQCPEWFRDAKFGIWAHWGPQCEPEHGDWYARLMYIQGSADYDSHVREYGHPSTNGFKDVIHDWKAENFNPDKLLAFYKKNGARYFMALADHHDNFDNWNSKYQPWNSVNIGPHKDLIAGWATAARKYGLRFGVSVHASHAWSWYEVAQGADTNGPRAGVPYDGKLTKADGKGQWWDGLDPQDLYAQNHTPGEKLVWTWDQSQGSSVPDAAYMEKYFKRVKQLWDDYRPDMVYFDDGVLPFHGVTDQIGLDLAAHFYNSSIQWHHGQNEAVMTDKHLSEMERRAQVYDIERGRSGSILPQPWETDTCLGSWHYDRAIFEQHRYKTAAVVIPMLADVVSKNGNLLLSVPLQRDGTPDSDEINIVNDIGTWLKINGEAIYATRPCKIFGEGTWTQLQEKGKHPVQQLTAQDIRFTQSKDGKFLYAIVLAIPADGNVTIKSLADGSPNWPGKIGRVRLLGGGKLKFTRDSGSLRVQLPDALPSQIAFALKIEG